MHCFMPGHTINSILRYHNSAIMDANELAQVTSEFIVLNGLVVPKAGEAFKIPTLPKYEKDL